MTHPLAYLESQYQGCDQIGKMNMTKGIFSFDFEEEKLQLLTKRDQFLRDVYGHEDLKELFWGTIQGSLHTKLPVHKLMIGDPGTGKSTILVSLSKYLHNAKLILGTRSTKAGIVDFIFRNPDIKFLCIDELDKMPKPDQGALLNLMTTGDIEETLKTRQRKIHVDCSVIAAANEKSGIIEPIMDRFYPVIYMPKITKAEYAMIGKSLLTKREKFGPEEADLIIDVVGEKFSTNHSMRTLVTVARSLDSDIENLPKVVKTMLAYGKRG